MAIIKINAKKWVLSAIAAATFTNQSALANVQCVESYKLKERLEATLLQAETNLNEASRSHKAQIAGSTLMIGLIAVATFKKQPLIDHSAKNIALGVMAASALAGGVNYTVGLGQLKEYEMAVSELGNTIKDLTDPNSICDLSTKTRLQNSDKIKLIQDMRHQSIQIMEQLEKALQASGLGRNVTVASYAMLGAGVLSLATQQTGGANIGGGLLVMLGTVGALAGSALDSSLMTLNKGEITQAIISLKSSIQRLNHLEQELIKIEEMKELYQLN